MRCGNSTGVLPAARDRLEAPAPCSFRQNPPFRDLHRPYLMLNQSVMSRVTSAILNILNGISLPSPTLHPSTAATLSMATRKSSGETRSNLSN